MRDSNYDLLDQAQGIINEVMYDVEDMETRATDAEVRAEKSIKAVKELLTMIFGEDHPMVKAIFEVIPRPSCEPDMDRVLNILSEWKDKLPDDHKFANPSKTWQDGFLFGVNQITSTLENRKAS